MRKFIDFIIRLLISAIILLFLVLIGISAYFFIVSYQQNIDIEDTVSYVKTISEDIITTVTNTTLSNTISPSISLGDIDKNTAEQIEVNHLNKYRYYYNELDDNGKLIYTKIENNIEELKNNNFTIDFGTKFNTLLNTSNGQDELNKSFQSALDAFFYDYPEIFYIDLSKISLLIKSTTLGPKTTYSVSISPTNSVSSLGSSFYSKDSVDTAVTKVENIRNSIISSVTATDNYNKALQVHDYLVNLLEYDETLNRENTHNIYGALINKSVVCEGYAKTYKYILDSMGIENILVSGIGTNSEGQSESHLWNYIKLDNNWYGVDVTWDDPVIIGSGFTKNIVRHNYFCKGSSSFNQNHFAENKISDTGMAFTLPILNITDYKK